MADPRSQPRNTDTLSLGVRWGPKIEFYEELERKMLPVLPEAPLENGLPNGDLGHF